MTASSSQPRKFTFDTVFDGDRVIARAAAPTRRSFTADEMEAARAAAYAEGQRAVVAGAEAAAAAALGEAAGAIRAAMGALTRIVHEHRTASAELALAAARKIADAALDRFPEEPALAALDALGREIEVQPRLVVRCAPAGADRLAAALDQAADAAGYPGQLVVKADPALPRAAFQFDWGDGRASFDPAAAAARIAEALELALAAEGLHAEPITLASGDAA